MRALTLEQARGPALAGGVLLLGALCWVYARVLEGMVSEWYNNPDHSHGFLIPLISGYFLWTRRDALKSVVLRPSNWGSVVLAGGLMMFVLGDLGAAYTTTRVSMIIALAGIILFIYGWAAFRAVSLPFFYLLFMIPVPTYLYDAVSFPLKIFVTKSSVLIMKLAGVPALREGNVIMLQNITLQVIDACSGIRSLVSLLAVGVALAYLSQRTGPRKVMLVLAAFPIAVATNVLRVVITGLLARSFGGAVAGGFLHEFAGIWVFLLSVGLLILTGAALSRAGKGRGAK